MDGGLLNSFIHYLQFEKRYSALTITAYRHDLEQFTEYYSTTFQSQDLLGVTHFHVRSWLASLIQVEMKARTVNRKISSLSSFYKFLRKIYNFFLNFYSKKNHICSEIRLFLYSFKNFLYF